MAGGTSRVSKTLVFSFAAACGLIVLLMKKKRQAKKSLSHSIAVAVESGETSTGISSFRDSNAQEAQLVAQSDNPTDFYSSSEGVDMLFKEKKMGTKNSDACSHSNSSVSTPNGVIVKESKAYENLSTCIIISTSEGVTNGISHSQDDKVDNKIVDAAVSIKQKSVALNGSYPNGNHTDLVNGVDCLSLEDPDHNNIDTPHSNSDIDQKEEASSGFKSFPEAKVNGRMPFSGDSQTKTLLVENGLQEDCVSQNISPMSELSCDTNFIPPKAATPDSGVSGEFHESDAASSSMSEPSSECALSGLGDMLKSPVTSVSSDSGKDCSENPDEIDQIVPGAAPGEPQLQVFEFEIPQELCGYLIGKNGRHVKFIKEESNAEIYIKRHPLMPHMKTCAVTGMEEEIEIALSIIRERFPSEKFPELTLEPINIFQPECTLPVTLKLALPEGVTFDAILSATVTPGHFFLQQPTHPTYHTLPLLTSGMSAWYTEFEAPKLVRVACDAIVAVPYAGLWYRAQVSTVHPDTQQCTVRFLDYGGYELYDLAELRQIRFEFAQVPFQATECYLGSITYPEGETSWSEQAKTKFEELAQGQIIQGYIVGYDQTGVPYVHLYTAQGATGVFINRELVNAGFARWTNQEDVQEETSVTASTTEAPLEKQ